MDYKAFIPFSKAMPEVCDHHVIFQSVCEDIFEKFKANYDYIVASDQQFIAVATACNLCKKDIHFIYNLERRILEPDDVGMDEDLKKRLTYHDCDVPLKCKFIVKYDSMAESLDEKTLFLIKIHNLFRQDSSYLNITKNYVVTDNGITLLEGEVSNIIPATVDYVKFKTLYRAFTKEFNKDFKVIIER